MTERTDELIVEKPLTVAGVPTRVLEVAGAGPTIILIHGYTDSADTFRFVLAQLAAAGRHAVAVDLPGHGVAGPAGRPIFPAFDAFAADLVHRYAAGGPVVLAGNSLGGLIALRAAYDPDLPIGTTVGLGPAGLAYRRQVPLLAAFSRLTDPIARPVDALPVPRSVLRRLALRLHKRLCEGQTIQPIADYFASHLDTMRDLARMRSMLVALGVEEDRDPLNVSRIRTPVLLLWGTRDHLVPIESAPLLLDVVPDSRLVALDCGHLPQVQRPTEVARELLALSPT